MLRSTLLTLLVLAPACDQPTPEQPVAAWEVQTAEDATAELRDRAQNLRDALSTQVEDPEVRTLLARLDEVDVQLEEAIHADEDEDLATRLVAIEDELSAIENGLLAQQPFGALEVTPHPVR